MEHNQVTYKHNPNTIIIDADGNQRQTEGFFVSLAVRNAPCVGHQTARDCKARIIAFEKFEPPDQFVEPPTFVPGTLLWANQGVDEKGNLICEPLDVETGVRTMLGVCASYKSEPGVHLSTERKRHAGRREDFPLGNYRIRIRVYIDERVRGTEADFVIMHNGPWDKVTIRQVSTRCVWGEKRKRLVAARLIQQELHEIE